MVVLLLKASTFHKSFGTIPFFLFGAQTYVVLGLLNKNSPGEAALKLWVFSGDRTSRIPASSHLRRGLLLLLVQWILPPPLTFRQYNQSNAVSLFNLLLLFSPAITGEKIHWVYLFVKLIFHLPVSEYELKLLLLKKSRGEGGYK